MSASLLRSSLQQPAAAGFAGAVTRRLQRWVRAPTSWGRSVLWALACVALATLMRYLLGYLEPGMAPYALYFPAVLLASLLGGWRGGGIASLLSVAVESISSPSGFHIASLKAKPSDIVWNSVS